MSKEWCVEAIGPRRGGPKDEAAQKHQTQPSRLCLGRSHCPGGGPRQGAVVVGGVVAGGTVVGGTVVAGGTVVGGTVVGGTVVVVGQAVEVPGTMHGWTSKTANLGA